MAPAKKGRRNRITEGHQPLSVYRPRFTEDERRALRKLAASPDPRQRRRCVDYLKAISSARRNRPGTRRRSTTFSQPSAFLLEKAEGRLGSVSIHEPVLPAVLLGQLLQELGFPTEGDAVDGHTPDAVQDSHFPDNRGGVGVLSAHGNAVGQEEDGVHPL